MAHGVVHTYINTIYNCKKVKDLMVPLVVVLLVDSYSGTWE